MVTSLLRHISRILTPQMCVAIPEGSLNHQDSCDVDASRPGSPPTAFRDRIQERHEFVDARAAEPVRSVPEVLFGTSQHEAGAGRGVQLWMFTGCRSVEPQVHFGQLRGYETTSQDCKRSD